MITTLTALLTLVALLPVLALIVQSYNHNHNHNHNVARQDTSGSDLVDKIETLLPQTQCCRCGYQGCRGYAQALTEGAELNRCPPGGVELIEILQQHLHAESTDYVHPDRAKDFATISVQIDESSCIGCTKCIQVCPTAAIAGGINCAHTVLPDLCTGCGLCVPVCPTDCIEEIPDARQDRSDHRTPQAKRRRDREFIVHQRLDAWVEAWPNRRNGLVSSRAPVPIATTSSHDNQQQMRRKLTEQALAKAQASDDGQAVERLAIALTQIDAESETKLDATASLSQE